MSNTKQTLKTVGTRTLLLVVVFLFANVNVVSALNADQLFSQNYNTSHYDPTFCGNGAGAEGASDSSVIVIDPGHSKDKIYSGKPQPPVTNSYGLYDWDYPNDNEIEQVFQVSMQVRKKLMDAGYTVLMTKGGSNPKEGDWNTNVGLEQRAEIANNASAALGVSIHYDNSRSWGEFAEVYTQKSNKPTEKELYRTTVKGKDLTLADFIKDKAQLDKVVTASQTAGEKMRDARKKAEGRSVDLTNVPNFKSRPGFSPGNIPQVQLYSKVPWIYNEVGTDGDKLSDAHMKAYADGIVAGIKEAVKLDQGNSRNTQANEVSSAVKMEEVDTSAFKPDNPTVKNHFDKEDLPKMKQYIPLYVKAAQLEGVPQNWEILAGLHGAETDFGSDWEPNSLGYTGPFQQGPGELKDYLKDKDYKDALSTLVTPDGQLKKLTGKKLTDDQFVVLARLVFHRWVYQGLTNWGKDPSKYDVVKKGPIKFVSAGDIDENSVFWKIMGRYNHGAEGYEGFTGYGKPRFPWGMGTEVGSNYQHLGVATMYYMLKNWEKDGGMATIVTTGGSQDCKEDSSGSAATGDCTTGTGNAKILLCAKVYDPISYEQSLRGGHQGAANWHKTCPKIGPSCVLDCSGLVSIAVYDAFGYDKSWNTWALADDNKNWHDISPDELQPGDIIEPHDTHVEIVDHVEGNRIHTFGAHSSTYPQPKQVGPSQFPKQGNYAYLRYYGPGSQYK